jgi:hypothetical protein
MRGVVNKVGVYDARSFLVIMFRISGVTLLATIFVAMKVARIDSARTLRGE